MWPPSLAPAELVGYVASVLVAASLMMTNARWLRLVNLVGAVIFVVYGALVRALPVLCVNLFIACVNVYYLRQMSRRAEFFSLLPVRGDDPFTQRFVRFHREDIRRFFPDLDEAALRAAGGCFVLRNMLPVALFVHRALPDDRVEILLDYAVVDYRDRKNAEFMFSVLNERFAAEGKKAFVVRTRVPAHARYIEHEGFRPSDDGAFVRPIV